MGLPNQPDVDGVKKKNIIDMALGFTAMMRIFSKKSKDIIRARLEDFFSQLAAIRTADDYKSRHRLFCEWFTCTIRSAEKKLKNGKILLSESSSYGQAAKVLDIAVKVYVYYCSQPNAETAQRIVIFLNGAIDTPILKWLKKSECSRGAIRAATIKGIDQEAYDSLQLIVHAESRARDIHPVQFDDVLWRQLSRDTVMLTG